jgi:hypothetical protein
MKDYTICPVVCTNNHDVLVSCEAAAIINDLASSTIFEAATIYPKHNRFASSTIGRCIDIEVQAILAFTWITASAEPGNCEVALRFGIWVQSQDVVKASNLWCNGEHFLLEYEVGSRAEQV